MVLFSRFRLLLLLNIGCITLLVYAMDLNKELMNTASDGNLQKVQKLINAGANVNAQYRSGSTALMCATRGSNKDIIVLLLKHGAQVNTQDHTGLTALMLAAIYSSKDIVALVLEHGAQINAQADTGKTALMHAAYWGNNATVELLLKYGADSSIISKDNRTALDFAKEGAQESINPKRREDCKKIIAMLIAHISIKKKLNVLREQAARECAKQYPGIPAQEIIKYLK